MSRSRLSRSGSRSSPTREISQPSKLCTISSDMRVSVTMGESWGQGEVLRPRHCHHIWSVPLLTQGYSLRKVNIIMKSTCNISLYLQVSFPQALGFKDKLFSVTQTQENAFQPCSCSINLVTDNHPSLDRVTRRVVLTCALPTLICFGLHLVRNGAGDLKIREQGDSLRSLKVHSWAGKMSCATQKDLGGIGLKNHHIALHFRDGDTGFFTKAPV